MIKAVIDTNVIVSAYITKWHFCASATCTITGIHDVGEKLSTLLRQISWSNNLAIMPRKI